MIKLNSNSSVFFFFVIIICTAVWHIPNALSAADSGTLIDAFNHIYEPEIDTVTYDVNNLTIRHKDFELILASGRLCFYKPVIIDSTEYYFGAYFKGESNLRFRPSVDLERDQMRRFFKSDSLDRYYKNITMIFGENIYRQIIENEAITSGAENADLRSEMADEFSWLTKKEERTHVFQALKSLLYPPGQSYLLVNAAGGEDRIFYIYDPFKREQVKLYKHFWYWHEGGQFMEEICSYAKDADDTHVNINGIEIPEIRISHFDIDAIISTGGDMTAAVDMTFQALNPAMRLVKMNLHSELKIDSILNSRGENVSFLRYNKDSNKSSALYLILNHPPEIGTSTKLSFYYQGEIAEKYEGLFYLTAGADWYPTHVASGDRTIFDIRYRTPQKYQFASTGKKLASHVVGDTLITRWQVSEPCRNISFSIGYMKRYEFKEGDVPPVEIYYDKDTHADMANALSFSMVGSGKHMEKRVADDVINAIRLFTNYFGPYPYDNMCVSELMAGWCEAFPGFIHLGTVEWIKNDEKGYRNATRAHEVAHQWWGIGVDYETYHDKWLSEGFAEYSGLLYVQAALDNDHFLRQLEDYRDEIFSVRHYLLGGGEESGPIAMGYRTSSTETPGDYGLIIYKKAAYCLHMLRNMMIDFKTMKEDAFFDMLKEFYQTYSGKKATTRDFRKLTEKYIGMDMTWFFDQWIYSNELPTYEFKYEYEQDDQGLYSAICHIVTEGVGDDFMMYIPLEIEIDAGRKAYIRILVDSNDYTFTMPGLPKIPGNLKLNPFMSVLARVKQ